MRVKQKLFLFCVEEIHLTRVNEEQNPNALASGYDPVNSIFITDVIYEFICLIELRNKDVFHPLHDFFNSRSKELAEYEYCSRILKYFLVFEIIFISQIINIRENILSDFWENNPIKVFLPHKIFFLVVVYLPFK